MDISALKLRLPYRHLKRRKLGLIASGLIAFLMLKYIYEFCLAKSYDSVTSKRSPFPAVDEISCGIPKNITVNKTWKIQRDLVRKKGGFVPVILFSYARSGSTLLSDVFNIDPNTTHLWYEALQGFHSYYSGLPEYSNELRLLYHKNKTRRCLDERKLNELTKYLEDLLECRVHEIPVTTFAHAFMTKTASLESFWSCVEAVNGSRRLAECQRIIDRHCYVEEYLGVYPRRSPTSRVGQMTCADVLGVIRSWNLDNDEVDLDHNQLLVKALKEMRLSELEEYFRTNCLQTIVSNYFNRIASLTETHANTFIRNLLVSFWKAYTIRSRPDNDDCSALSAKFVDFLDNTRCLADLDSDTRHCRKKVRNRCDLAVLRVASVHRVSLGNLESLIRRNPSLSVVHYVRDPRAVAVSRSERRYHTYRSSKTWTVVDEAEFICVRMADEIRAAGYLRGTYPGSVFTVRYEDLVRYPRFTIERMYKRFGKAMPRSNLLERWIEKTLRARKDNGMYGIERKNGVAHISQWRNRITEQDLVDMTKRCQHVLEKLDYEVNV